MYLLISILSISIVIFFFKKNREILVIGSSPNLLNVKNGNKIDKYEYICRFNDYQTEGFEDYVGTRTTHWMTGVSKNAIVKGRIINNLTVLCAYNLNTFEERKRKRKRKRKQIVQDRLKINPNKTNEISRNQIKLIMDKTGIDYLSTGLIGVGYFLFIKKYKVTVTGFDHFQSEKQHYYTNKNLESIGKHSFNEEKILFNKWMKNGTIKKL